MSTTQSALTSTSNLGPGDFVKVTYAGQHRLDRDGGEYFDDQSPFVFRWDSKPYLVEVGQTGFVPFEAMSLALGDPRSTAETRTARDTAGNVMWIVDRPTEVRRLRVLYGNLYGSEDEIGLAPTATVTDLEGNPITTVLNDPQGDSVLPVNTTILDREQLLAQLQRQQRQIEALASAQGVDLEPEDETDDLDDEPVPPKPDPFAQPPEDK